MLKAKVTRPAFDESLPDHPAVKLTAVVSSGSVRKEFELNVRVKMEGITDSQAVILDLNDINLPDVAFEDLTLPALGKNGSIIKWKSSNSAVITAAGKLTRPSSTEEDVIITMTAEATKGVEKNTKDYEVGVTAWTMPEEMEDAKARVNWDLIKGVNTNSQAITDDLVLPATVGRNVKCKWITSSSNLDVATGKITRPSYTQGQVTLRLTCELTHGDDLGELVELPIFVIASLPMTDQEVLSTAKSLLEASSFLGENESLQRIKEDMHLPFRVNDPDASRAVVSWKLASIPGHTDLATHPNIRLTDAAEWTLAAITRPTAQEGNQKVALKATITVGVGPSKIEDTKYFDLQISIADV